MILDVTLETGNYLEPAIIQAKEIAQKTGVNWVRFKYNRVVFHISQHCEPEKAIAWYKNLVSPDQRNEVADREVYA